MSALHHDITVISPSRSPQRLMQFGPHAIGTIDLMPLAFAIFQQDQFTRRRAGVPTTTWGELTDPQFADYLQRARVAMAIGDPATRDRMADAGAMAILRGVLRGIADGTITADSPLAKLDLSTAKHIAKLAVAGGIACAGGNPLGRATATAVGPIPGAAFTATKEPRHMSTENTNEGGAPPAEDSKPAEVPPTPPAGEGTDASGDAPTQ